MNHGKVEQNWGSIDKQIDQIRLWKEFPQGYVFIHCVNLIGIWNNYSVFGLWIGHSMDNMPIYSLWAFNLHGKRKLFSLNNNNKWLYSKKKSTKHLNSAKSISLWLSTISHRRQKNKNDSFWVMNQWIELHIFMLQFIWILNVLHLVNCILI